MERCCVSHYAGGLCAPYGAYPKENELVLLGECTRDIKLHLKSIRLSTGQQTKVNAAADTEGILIASRIGLFRFDPSLTVCPYHRYSLGIHWKPSRSCAFPSHKGSQKPQRAITSEMSKHIFTTAGVLLLVGSGICMGCINIYNQSLSKECSVPDDREFGAKTICETVTADGKEDIQTCENEKDTSAQELDIHEVRRSTAVSHNELVKRSTAVSHNELGRSIQEAETIWDSQESLSLPVSQTSNWSEEHELGLTDINQLLQPITRGASSPLRSQLRQNLADVHSRTVRYYKRKASETVDAVLELIAPGQSSALKKLLMNTESTEVEKEAKEEFQRKMIELYNQTTDNNLKVQILAVISKGTTKTELIEKIPGLTVYKVDQARKFSNKFDGFTIPTKTIHHRQRMDSEKLQHALDFFFDPMFMQIVSFGTRDLTFDSGEKLTIPDVVRTSCHLQMIQLYENYCQESNFAPLGRSTLFQILKVCSASKRKSLQGLDNTAAEGAEGYQALKVIADRLNDLLIITGEEQKELHTKISASLIYMKSDFKIHVKESDMCADHCISWSLSDPLNKDFQRLCDHPHPIQCDRCNLVSEVKEQLLAATSNIPDQDIQEEFQKRISDSIHQILMWKSHIIRTVNQDKFRIDALRNLQHHQMFIVMDWAMKFLPMKYREKQTDWFGQRGMNWHVTVCIHRDPDGNLCHRTLTHVLDGTKQDWFCVSSLLEDVLQTIKHQLPNITEIFLRSDNAACYHCGHLWLCLPVISSRTGLHIKTYCYSEPQSGKSYCDSKIAHMKRKMKSWVASGHDIICAEDMKVAIDSISGVSGCQVAQVFINPENQSLKSHKMKRVSMVSEVGFNHDGSINMRKAYGIGVGELLSSEELDRYGGNRQHHHQSGCITLNGFQTSTPITATGKIENPKEPTPVSTESALYFCPESGCICQFHTFADLDSHLTTGQHQLQLQRETTYDHIRREWARLCNDVVITYKDTINAPISNSSDSSDNIKEMGWALKGPRRHVRKFGTKIREFLDNKFRAGEVSGCKANPTDVAREMQSMRNDAGERIFPPSEWLSANQITSYFSRRQSCKGNEQIQDEDLLAAIDAIDRDGVIQEIKEDLKCSM